MKVYVVCLIAATSLVGCGKKEKKGNSTYAKLTVSNSTAINLTQSGGLTPSVFGLKLIDVRILQELDTRNNPAPVIWYNPECGTSSTTETEVDGKTYEYTQSPGCDPIKITKFFDFARSTSDVNTELNSQPNKVYPATYKYVSISWCGGSATENVQFQADGMPEPALVASGGCGSTSAEAVPPLVISDGETVTISLDYSIEGIVTEQGSGNNCWKSTDGTVNRCIEIPNMTPSVTKS